MNESEKRAAELQLDACLAEYAGMAVRVDAGARLAARLHAESARQVRWRTALAATVLVGGSLVAWLVIRAIGPYGESSSAAQQGPVPQQDGVPADKAVTAEVDRLLTLFELPARRQEMWRELDARLPTHARVVMERLIAAEARAAGRPELLAAYGDLLRLLTPRMSSRRAEQQTVLIADYSENLVAEAVLGKGAAPAVLMREVFGVWDVEPLADGTLLLTEFSVSRVRQVNGAGEQLWAYEDLKNPYDADLLRNGHVLIADTFGDRVIEVDRAGKVVWSYADDVRPCDADRLGNGNTLIADFRAGRVLEVSPEGKVVWEVGGLQLIHDADRLLDGRTLVTLRDAKSVRELDTSGAVVWRLDDLQHPSDADRLPNGNTLVAENGRVREYDRDGNVVWETKVSWAVEACRR